MEKGWRGWIRGWYRKMNRFRSWPQIKIKVKILWMLVKRKEEKNWKQTEKKEVIQVEKINLISKAKRERKEKDEESEMK